MSVRPSRYFSSMPAPSFRVSTVVWLNRYQRPTAAPRASKASTAKMCLLICLGGVSAGTGKGSSAIVCLVAWEKVDKLWREIAVGAIYPQCRLDCQDESRQRCSAVRAIRKGHSQSDNSLSIWDDCGDFSGLRVPVIWFIPHALRVGPMTDLAVLSRTTFLMSGLRRSCRW